MENCVPVYLRAGLAVGTGRFASLPQSLQFLLIFWLAIVVNCADNGITMEMVSLDPGVTIGPTWIAGGVANDIPLSLFLLMLLILSSP